MANWTKECERTAAKDPARARPQVPTVPGNQLHPDSVLAHVVTAARSSRHIMRTPTTAQDSA
ncbi:hypothetical protein [Streptomyces sp. NPDC056661]|uniref:hypothetical protein n=1 Tax=Streptomyces sp. NPDC056661 TaxID=3345898 RepID=UPI0036B15233